MFGSEHREATIAAKSAVPGVNPGATRLCDVPSIVGQVLRRLLMSESQASACQPESSIAADLILAV
jgi:hypothetical protein